MAIDFHYVPLPPEPISGNDVLKQTEEAINELGNHIDTEVSGILDIANQALTTAQQAISTANAASQTANEAVTIANEASAKADGYQDQINKALADAQSAISTATAAGDLAQSAIDQADAANTASSEALEAAQNALAAAQQAANDATSAISTAETALQIALSLAGVYTRDETEDLDANTRFDSSAKIYPTGASIVNFPAPAPLFFQIDVTSPLEYATQRVWTIDGLQEWRRVAQVTPATDDTPASAVWGEWVPIGGIPEENPGWLPLFFVLPSEDPSRSMIPPGYTTASLQSYETNAASTTITLEASPAVGGGDAIAIPAYPETVDISALASKGVNFTVNYEGDEPSEIFALVRLST